MAFDNMICQSSQVTFFGILAGFISALLQSIAYLISRAYIVRKVGTPADLILVSQCIMGLVSIPVAVLSHDASMAPLEAYIIPLLLCSISYLAAQTALLAMIRHVQISRIAPMLGLKIVILAVICTCFMDQHLSARQWAAVLLATSAVVLMNFSGQRIPFAAILALLVACTGYSISDICIRELISRLSSMALLRASIYAAAASYIICGAIVLPLIIIRRKTHLLFTSCSLPVAYSALWLVCMFALYFCFAAIGPVFGNIIQSSRGLISVLLAIPAARLGYHYLEPASSPDIFIKRIAAAVMICASVYLFS